MTAMRWADCVWVALYVAVANEGAVGSRFDFMFSQATGGRKAGLCGGARGGWMIIRSWGRAWLWRASRPFGTSPEGQSDDIRKTER